MPDSKLTRNELAALQRISQGGPRLREEMHTLASLLDRGLIVKKLGGYVITELGQRHLVLGQ